MLLTYTILPRRRASAETPPPETAGQIVLDIELPTPDTVEGLGHEPSTDTNTNTTNTTTTSATSATTPSQHTSLSNPRQIECPVCLEDKQIYIKMKCGHNLCLGCANNWFGENQSCPVCRNQISQTPDNLVGQQQELPEYETESIIDSASVSASNSNSNSSSNNIIIPTTSENLA